VNNLIKDAKYYMFYPPPVLQKVPAYSYEEIRYVTSESDAYTVNDVIVFKIIPRKIKQPNTDRVVVFTENIPGKTLEILKTSISNNGNRAIKVVVKVPESYSWFTPVPYIKEFNIVGWNGGAVSKQYFINYGEAEFSIDETAVGVIAGLTSTNNAVENAHYSLIKYAFYGTLGKYSIFINGSDIGLLSKNYNSTTKFKIIVGFSGIKFLVNNVEEYSYSVKPEISTYNLDTSLYNSFDRVLNASIKQVSYAEIGVISSVLNYIIMNGVKYQLHNNNILINNIWYSAITNGYVIINGLLYNVDDNKIFYNGLIIPVINNTVTVSGVPESIYNISYDTIIVINANIYSVFTEIVNINNQKYPTGYWVVGLDCNLISKDYSSSINLCNIGCNLEPYYDLTSTILLESSLIYLGGTYISSQINIDNSIYTEYVLNNKINLGNVLYYVGYSYISNELKFNNYLFAGGLTPTIPPKLVNGFELNCSLRNYFIEDPSLFVIL